MAIRLRQIAGHTVALCAAETDPQPGDVYLDDSAHHALSTKFALDWQAEGLLANPPFDKTLAELMAREKVRDAKEELEAWIRASKLTAPINYWEKLQSLLAEFKEHQLTQPQGWLISQKDHNLLAQVLYELRECTGPGYSVILTYLLTGNLEALRENVVELFGLRVLSWEADETKVV